MKRRAPSSSGSRRAAFRLALPSAVAWGVALLLHGLLLTLAHWPAPRVPIGDEPIYLAAADAAAAGEPMELELLWPPLYPRLLARLGTGLEGGRLLRAQLLQSLLLLAVALLLRNLSLRLGARRWTAELAGAFAFGFPPLAAYAQYFWPEVLHLLLWVAMLWMLAARAPAATGWRRWPWAALFGWALGLALLAKSLLQPFAPLLIVAWAVAASGVGRPEAPPRRWREAALGITAALLAATVALATLHPTLAEHRERYGVFAIANSAAINLWVGLNDTARRDRVEPVVRREMYRYRHVSDHPSQRQAWAQEQVRTLIAERGAGTLLAAQLGRQYFRLFDKDSFFTGQLPGGLLTERERGYLAAPRWLARVLRGLSYGLYAALLAAVAGGLALVVPGRRVWVWTVFAFVAYNLALFLLVHVKSRYREQLLPVLLPLAAVALTRVANWIATRRGDERRSHATDPAPLPPLPRWRWALAGALASLALFFAFAGPLLDG